MKKPFLVVALLLCLPAFTACDGALPARATATGTAAPAQTETARPTPAATPAPTPSPTPAPTPAGVYAADVYDYFARVGFAGGTAAAPVVAKWASPIRIQAAGAPDDGDRKALAELVDAFEGIAGAPEIVYVTAGGNLLVDFLPKADASDAEGYDGSANHYVYAEWGDSPRAVIFIADELTARQERDAALAASFFRALGLQADADGQYDDSVLNPDSGAAKPSERDLLMLALLYSAELTPGMARAEALAVAPTLNPEAAAPVPLARTARLDYFNEVGFYWADKAGDGIVSKWVSPVKLEIRGEPAPELKTLLDEYIVRLNGIAGFPGISVVEAGGNFVVTFAPRADIARDYPGMAAAEACAWKPTRGKNGAISACRIGAANDFADGPGSASQFLRVFAWSLGLNFTSDTVPDSILNLSAAVQDWSAMDWAMVETLYRVDVKPGAKRAAVMAGLLESLK